MKTKITMYAAVGVLVLSVLACGTSTVPTPTPTSPPTVINTPTVVNTPTIVNTPTVVNTPVPPASDLVINSSTAFVDSYGTYHVFGEVVNNSSKILSSIELTVEIKDAAGKSLIKDDNGNIKANEIFSPMLYTLAPAESSPFEYTFDTTNGTPVSFKVTITGQATSEANRATLKSENVQLLDDGTGGYILTGELVNTGSQWAHINNLAGAVKDDSGKVLSADWTATYVTELAPTGDANSRDRTPFEIDFPNPGGATQWQVYPDGEVIDNVTDYPIDVNVTSTYFDDFGSAHIVGWITNNSDQLLDSLVVAGLYAADDTVLDSGYSFVPVPLKPGEPTPFHIYWFSNVNYNPDQASLVTTYSVNYDPAYTYPTSSEYVDMTAVGDPVQKENASWTFNGTVTNTSSKSLNNIIVVAMVMDAENNLIAMESTYIYPTGDAIAVGETNTYSVSISLDPTADLTGFTTTTLVVGQVK